MSKTESPFFRRATDSTIAQLLRPGTGLLAADESLPTIAKRFKACDIPLTEENRRAYREMLFTAPGLGAFIGGAILFDETLRQTATGGLSMGGTLKRQGIVPGIKVDGGTVGLPGTAGETMTAGLDGLRERLDAYRGLEAQFTKWRAVISMGDGLPSRGCLRANARLLALFAALSQEAGLVPIVEPEVLMDGTHSIERCEEVTTATLREVFSALVEQGVVLESMILKSGMVLSGKENPDKADPELIAASTLRCFRRTVPAAVPGIVFLSGGQGEIEATVNLDAICRRSEGPWKVSFSYGRALQDSALRTWNGTAAKVEAAQKVLLHRARCNALAVQGAYTPRFESEGQNS